MNYEELIKQMTRRMTFIREASLGCEVRNVEYLELQKITASMRTILKARK